MKRPRVWLPSLLLLYPAVLSLIINFLLPDNLNLKILYFSLLPMSFIPHKLLVVALLIIFEWHILRNIVASLLSFTAWAIVVTYLSKKIKYEIETRYLPLYFFVYSPLWMTVCSISLVKVLIFKMLGREVRIKDWVV